MRVEIEGEDKWFFRHNQKTWYIEKRYDLTQGMIEGRKERIKKRGDRRTPSASCPAPAPATSARTPPTSSGSTPAAALQQLPLDRRKRCSGVVFLTTGTDERSAAGARDGKVALGGSGCGNGRTLKRYGTRKKFGAGRGSMPAAWVTNAWTPHAAWASDGKDMHT